jgi:hypothetical protein
MTIEVFFIAVVSLLAFVCALLAMVYLSILDNTKAVLEVVRNNWIIHRPELVAEFEKTEGKEF